MARKIRKQQARKIFRNHVSNIQTVKKLEKLLRQPNGPTLR